MLAALAVCRALGVPVTAARRGHLDRRATRSARAWCSTSAGTSNRILDIDPAARTARVQPGVVLATLQTPRRRTGCASAPTRPRTARCTLGGMIGNNACGSHSVAYGRTADNVRGAGRGRPTAAGGCGSPRRGRRPGARRPATRWSAANLAPIRTEFGRFRRQVSGYSLEHLLPEHGFNLARALVGTEGTLAVLLGATVRLVPTPPRHGAGRARLPRHARRRRRRARRCCRTRRSPWRAWTRAWSTWCAARRAGAGVPPCPRGDGWLFVEIGGDVARRGESRGARALVADAGALDRSSSPTRPQAAALWRIREDGAGLAGRTADGRRRWPGWEDAAVPPERLGALPARVRRPAGRARARRRCRTGTSATAACTCGSTSR